MGNELCVQAPLASQSSLKSVGLHQNARFSNEAETFVRALELSEAQDNNDGPFTTKYYFKVIKKMTALKRMQPKLFRAFNSLKTIKERKKFLQDVDEANLQILDSFYEHFYLKRNDQKLPRKSNKNQFCGTIVQKSWDILCQKNVNLVDLTKSESYSDKYEKLKESGLELIRERKVAFLMLAGGINLRYTAKTFKELDSFDQLPSGSCLLRLLWFRLQSLGALLDTKITLFILIGSNKKKLYEEERGKLKLSYLDITYIGQMQMGCIDDQGELLINEKNNLTFVPNGTGDIWSMIRDNTSLLEKFQYLQVFGLSNMLEHCFDCFMLGKIHREQLPWITMAAEQLLPVNSSPVIYINKEDQLHVCDSNQQGYPRNCPHLFANHTIFSLSQIQKVLTSSQWITGSQPRLKFIKFPDRNVLIFQKCYTDIFSFSRGGCVVLVDQGKHYCQFVSQEDRIACVQARSMVHKFWLGIHDLEGGICEIDPRMSLEGEGLEEVKEDILKQKVSISYPFYLAYESSDQSQICQEEDFTTLL